MLRLWRHVRISKMAAEQRMDFLNKPIDMTDLDLCTLKTIEEVNG